MKCAPPRPGRYRRLLARRLRAWRWAFGLLLTPVQGQPLPSELLARENIVDAARPRASWQPAPVGMMLYEHDRLRTGALSRASLRLTNLAVLRLNELTELELKLPESGRTKPTLDLKGGAIFWQSREKANELLLRTPLATGALRGTEFSAEVGPNGRTVVTMLDGEVELQNALGRVYLAAGEQGIVDPGKAPRKTAAIDATNIIQWCLYYPGVLEPSELGFTVAEKSRLAASLRAYAQGDLLGALKAWPSARLPRSSAERTYWAALLLEVGQVAQAEGVLKDVPRGSAGARALRQLIAAVQLQETALPASEPPHSASEWLAASYYQQSRGRLEEARQAARRATELSPSFGFGWTRLAELEFSFGRVSQATQALERGLRISPRHAQGYALQGFLLSAENRQTAALRSFEQARELDGALGNAWLGLGLNKIRQGHSEEGRRDLQVAAALEPNRSLLRSYLGKAFSLVGSLDKADLELQRAQDLDARDPTPWLYSALLRKQENRYNAAVEDLEHSLDLNENRRIFRSGFLLDQDRAVRGTNLAAIYQNNGLVEQSIREATRAVQSDYASASAHLFLANSYDALRDPARVQLRYETAWFNELLLAHLLSPVGGGPLSQFVSEQEYSKLFERDGLGFSTLSEYLSRGEVHATASQYGTFGNISYALDGEYLSSNGVRPNSGLELEEGYATFKLQLTPGDTVFLQTKFGRLQTGDVTQRYDPQDVERRPLTNGLSGTEPNRAAQTARLREIQDPGLLLLGLRHEWAPGTQTLLLLGRLGSAQTISAQSTLQSRLQRDGTTFLDDQFLDIAENTPELRNHAFFEKLRTYAGRGSIVDENVVKADLNYRSSFEAATADLQQICTFGPHALLLGGRYQSGETRTHVRLTNRNLVVDDIYERTDFDEPPARQYASVGTERVNGYLYDLWRVTDWLSLTGGVTYDHLKYPENFRAVPINDRQESLEQFSPKAGLLLQPWKGAAVRAAYTEAVGGTTFDESVRLEPVQVAGFLQGYRSAISESLLGSVAGSRYQLTGVSLEQKLPTRTYLGLEYSTLTQDLDRTIGVFDDLERSRSTIGVIPSSLAEQDRYREDVLTATINQLWGENWAAAVRYRYTHSRLRQLRPEAGANLEAAQTLAQENLANLADSTQSAGLHELSLSLLYNHPSGFFARGEANWYQQNNDRSVAVLIAGAESGILRAQNLGAPGDEFWQFNLLTGYRFYCNQCELSCGLLNITGEDYRLSPLTPYLELARERTLVVRCRLNF